MVPQEVGHPSGILTPASVPFTYFSLYFLGSCMFVVVSREPEQHDLHVIQWSLKLVPCCLHRPGQLLSGFNLLCVRNLHPGKHLSPSLEAICCYNLECSSGDAEQDQWQCHPL